MGNLTTVKKPFPGQSSKLGRYTQVNFYFYDNVVDIKTGFCKVNNERGSFVNIFDLSGHYIKPDVFEKRF